MSQVCKSSHDSDIMVGLGKCVKTTEANQIKPGSLIRAPVSSQATSVSNQQPDKLCLESHVVYAMYGMLRRVQQLQVLTSLQCTMHKMLPLPDSNSE